MFAWQWVAVDGSSALVLSLLVVCVVTRLYAGASMVNIGVSVRASSNVDTL